MDTCVCGECATIKYNDYDLSSASTRLQCKTFSKERPSSSAAGQNPNTCSHGGWIQTQNMNSGKLDNACTWLCFAYSLYLVVTSMAWYSPQNQLKSKKCLKQSQSVVCPVRHVIANGAILTNAPSFQLLPSHSYQQCFQTLCSSPAQL